MIVTPPTGAGNVVAFMARMARDALQMELELASESNQKGWTAPDDADDITDLGSLDDNGGLDDLGFE